MIKERNILVSLLFLCFYGEGQESKYQLMDQYKHKLYANLVVLKGNNIIESLLSTRNGSILLQDSLLLSAYNIEIYYGICFSNKIQVFRNTNLYKKSIMVTFNDSCFKLNSTVQKIKAIVLDITKHNNKIIKKTEFDLDSIKVQSEYYKSMIKTYNHFKVSGSNLMIDFYFKKDKLLACYIEEVNKYRKNYYKFTEYYFGNDDIIYTHCYETGETGFLVDHSKEYNNSLNLNFLKMITYKLLRML